MMEGNFNPCMGFREHFDKADEYREKVEYDVLKYIKDEWNSNLEVYTEVHYYGTLEITVFDEIDEDAFATFIIEEICKKYNLKVTGIERYDSFEDSSASYVEWHLRIKDDE